MTDLPFRRGLKAKPILERPEPLWLNWTEPASFGDALSLHLNRHGESAYHLHRSITRPSDTFDRATLRSWIEGRRTPRGVASLEILGRIEVRYRLPEGYFKSKLPHPGRALLGHKIDGITPAEMRRLAWHLPDDFNQRPERERQEIISWVRTVIISGATDYRRYQVQAMRHRYGVRFPTLTGRKAKIQMTDLDDVRGLENSDPDLLNAAVDAPARLASEMAALIRFKTATLTDIGFQRSGVWCEETSSQKIEHLGLMFGALAASPKAVVAGLGVPLPALSFALLLLPRVWDWYIQWREKRRGFYTVWEVEMLRLGKALSRTGTGWLRQNPHLAERLVPVESLITEEDIERIKTEWDGTCDTLHQHLSARAKEIERVARVHRDPFEPILPILEASSPLGEYRKIADEILKFRPDARRYPRAAAENARSLLLIRLGLHLGIRQKNLRQLMLCPKGHTPRTDRQLEALKRGEIRWSERLSSWEVLIPAVAFKNAESSFFGGKPFRLVLPNLGGLYDHIDQYVCRHRTALLNGVDDPGTFFIKTIKHTSQDAAYDQSTFYDAWRMVIQRYGIFNPYTGRGAIQGLLPHGPHNVRDVLATHILKQTGSYEQASYAIQDTPEMVAKHYGRFLPQDKAALAAIILNQVWEAA